MQSLGPNGTNQDLLKQIATFFLQNAFGGNFAFDLNKRCPRSTRSSIRCLTSKRAAEGMAVAVAVAVAAAGPPAGHLSIPRDIHDRWRRRSERYTPSAAERYTPSAASLGSVQPR